eukprot:GEMP01000082.1.p1 GENE.GEMP01000082.1~~GEMP01000082.1.p1  ORF type:complete len:3354 (+),score=631.52 GEMP01000082.1:157-10218(+)
MRWWSCTTALLRASVLLHFGVPGARGAFVLQEEALAPDELARLLAQECENDCSGKYGYLASTCGLYHSTVTSVAAASTNYAPFMATGQHVGVSYPIFSLTIDSRGLTAGKPYKLCMSDANATPAPAPAPAPGASQTTCHIFKFNGGGTTTTTERSCGNGIDVIYRCCDHTAQTCTTSCANTVGAAFSDQKTFCGSNANLCTAAEMMSWCTATACSGANTANNLVETWLSSRCLVDEHVVDGVCEACPFGLYNDAGDDPQDLQNTFCIGVGAVTDSTKSIYVQGIISLENQLFFRATDQHLVVNCYGCSTSTKLYVAQACDLVTTNGIVDGTPGINSKSEALVQSGTQWVVVLNFLELTAHTSYRVCADLDGSGGILVLHDTQLLVTITKITAISPYIRPIASARVFFTCDNCSLSGRATAYIAAITIWCETTVSGTMSASGSTRSASGTISGSGMQYSVPIDATALLIGQHYRLCVDMDGSAGPLTFADVVANDATLFLYITPLIGPTGVSVLKGQEAQLTLTTLSANILQSNARAYLGKLCDTASSGTVNQVFGVNTREKEIDRPAATTHTVTFDVAGDLNPGDYYKLCLDSDGDQLAMTFGDAGVTVFSGNGFEATTNDNEDTFSVQPTAAAKVIFTCDVSVCTSATTLYLQDGDCKRDVTNGQITTASHANTVSVSIQNEFQKKWYITVNTSPLKTGYWYRLCADFDGSGPLAFGPTDLDVYVSPVTELITPAVMTLVAQPVVFNCPGCQFATQAYLSLTSTTKRSDDHPCDRTARNGEKDIYGVISSESLRVSQSLTDGLWTLANIDGRLLLPGRNYHLCVDVDGISTYQTYGNSGMKVYVSAVNDYKPRALQRDVKQVITLYCPGCNPDNDLTEGYLALTCDTGRFDAVDPTTIIADVQLQSNTLNGPAGYGTPETTKLILDASPLALGQRYKLCVDIDGKSAKRAMGDTGEYVHISPIVAQITLSIKRATSQKIEMLCPSCSTNTKLYLSQECDSNVKNGVITGVADTIDSIALVAGADSDVFYVVVDASALLAGVHYMMCMDLDGATENLPFVNTGFVMYIAPFTVVSPRGMNLGVFEMKVTCYVGACGEATSVHLATLCDVDDRDGTVAGTTFTSPNAGLEAVSATEFVVQVYTSGLAVGAPYRVCIDIDGPAAKLAFGDSTFDFLIHDITSSTRLLTATATAKVTIVCSSCSITSRAYLGTECDTTLESGDIAVNFPLNTASALLVETTGAYILNQDTSGLTPGRYFKLCLDSDGDGADNICRIASVDFKPDGSKLTTTAQDAPCSETRNVGVRCCTLHVCVVFCHRAVSAKTYYEARQECIDRHMTLCSEVQLLSICEGGNVVENECTVDTVFHWALAHKYAIGNTGQDVYITPVTGIRVLCPTCTAILPAAAQVVYVTCPTCTTSSLAYVALECDITVADGAVPYIIGLTSTVQSLVGSAPEFTLTLDASQLDEGQHFKLCLDVDGTATSFAMGDTNQLVYITPFRTTQTNPLLRTGSQRLYFNCPRCTTTSRLYLSRRDTPCESWTDAFVQDRGSINTLTVNLDDEGNQVFSVALTAANLYLGEVYILCLDFDGPQTSIIRGRNYLQKFGDTGARALVSSIADVTPKRIPNTPPTSLQYTLPYGGTVIAPRTYLTTELCDTLNFSGVKAANGATNTEQAGFGKPDTTWLSTHDATVLTPGMHYRLCWDSDGVAGDFAFGDTGFSIYVLSIVVDVVGIFNAANQDIAVSTCVGCTSNTRVILADNCVSPTVQTPVVNLNSGKVTVDASLMPPGVHYQFCTDVDGSGPQIYGDTEYQVFISSVRVQTEKYVFMVSGASFTMTFATSATPAGYLAKSVCAISVAGGVLAASGADNTAAAVVSSSTLTLDTTALTPGTLAFVCIDEDGAAGPHTFGHTSEYMFVSPALRWVKEFMSIAPVSGVQMEFTCFPNACSTSMRGFLAFACDNAGTTPVQVEVHEAATHQYRITVDASSLQVGVVYNLCFDTAPALGLSGLKVYVGGITAIPVDDLSLFKVSSVVHLTCPLCTTNTMVSLCGATPPRALTGTSPNFSADIDSTKLTSKYYDLCTQIAPGGVTSKTGDVFYVSDVQTATVAVRPISGQTIQLRCPKCTTSSTIFLGAADCATPSNVLSLTGTSPAMSATLDASGYTLGNIMRLCIAMDGTTYGWAKHFVAISDVTVVAASTPTRAAAIFNQASQTVEFTCASCTTSMSAHVAILCDGTTEGTASATLVGASPTFTVSVDASALTEGQTQKLCVQFTTAPCDTGFEVYVSPVTTITTYLVANTYFTSLDVVCAACTTNTMVYLSLTCDVSVTDGTVGPPVAGTTAIATLVPTGNANVWVLRVASGLATNGRHHRVCVDFDGQMGAMRMGDTGLHVFIGSVLSVTPVALPLSSAGTFYVECIGCAATTSEAYLASATCDENDADGSVAASGSDNTASVAFLATGDATIFTATLDLSALTLGHNYLICFLFDKGNSAKTFGGLNYYIYITPVTNHVPYVPMHSGQSYLGLDCSACTPLAEAALALECPCSSCAKQTVIPPPTLAHTQTYSNTLAGLSDVRGIAFNAAATFAYVISFSENKMSVFTVDNNGLLTTPAVKTVEDGVGGVGGLSGPESIAVSPNGESIYLTTYEDNAVVHLRVASNNVVTFDRFYKDNQAGITLTDRPRIVRVSFDNTKVYVGSYFVSTNSHGITVFDRASDGSLTTNSHMTTINGASFEEPSDFETSDDGASLFICVKGKLVVFDTRFNFAFLEEFSLTGIVGIELLGNRVYAVLATELVIYDRHPVTTALTEFKRIAITVSSPFLFASSARALLVAGNGVVQFFVDDASQKSMTFTGTASVISRKNSNNVVCIGTTSDGVHCYQDLFATTYTGFGNKDGTTLLGSSCLAQYPQSLLDPTTLSDSLPVVTLGGPQAFTLGRWYKLCVDMDGAASSTSLLSDSGLRVFMSPFVTLFTPTVGNAKTSILRLRCGAYDGLCTTVILGYLARQCDPTLYGPVLVSTADNTLSVSIEDRGAEWRFTLDTTTLTPGYWYHLCVDIDGKGTTLHHGASGFQVYVTPSSMTITPRMILRATDQQLTLANAEAFQVALAYPSCSSVTENSAFSANGLLDASAFFSGADYVVCVKTTTSDSGPLGTQCVFVSPIIAVVEPHRLLGGQTDQVLRLHCPTCGAATEVYLSLACTMLTTGVVIARVSEAELEKWDATFDATALDMGQHYQLCVDIDGSGKPSYGGNANYEVYVSPVSAVTIDTQDAATISLTVTCAVCTQRTTAYLGEFCNLAVHNGRLKARSWRTESTLLIVTTTPASWLLVLRRHTIPAAEYRFCLDLDGALQIFSFGDTGLRVTVT